MLKFNDAKNYLIEYCNDFLHAHRLEPTQMRYDCPFCNSGTGKTQTPAFTIVQKDKTKFKCYACNRYGDVFELIQYQQPNVESRKDAFAWFEHYYNVRIDKRTIPQRTNANADLLQSTCNNQLTGINKHDAWDLAFIKQWHKDLLINTDAIKYLHQRGFDDEIIERAKIGFNEKTNCYILPYDNGYYIRHWQHGAVRYATPNADMQNEIYNKSILNMAINPIFVCEGFFDAWSIQQHGYDAIALCGCDISLLIQAIRESSTEQPIIAIFDNDTKGHANEQQLMDALKDKYMIFSFNNSYAYMEKICNKKLNDPNDCLLANKELFIKALKHNYDYANRQKRNPKAKWKMYANRFNL